jgi:hypothetical protein
MIWCFYHKTEIIILFFYGATAPSWPGPPHCRGFMITLRRTLRGRIPLDEWSARRRDLFFTTYNSYDKIHTLNGNRTHNPNKWPAVDPRLTARPLGSVDYLNTLSRPVHNKTIIFFPCCLSKLSAYSLKNKNGATFPRIMSHQTFARLLINWWQLEKFPFKVNFHTVP